MREINLSSMCHIFVISRGLPGHSLKSSIVQVSAFKERSSLLRTITHKWQKDMIFNSEIKLLLLF